MQSTGLRRTVRSLAQMHTFWVLAILLLMCVGFSLITRAGTFLSVGNFKNLAADASQLVILCVAATLFLIAGGLDLSIGSVIVLTSVVTLKLAALFSGYQADWLVVLTATVLAVIFATVLGAINGILATHFRIPAFIATLGMMGAALGFARLISGGTNVSGVPPSLMTFMNKYLLGLPMPVFIAALVAIVGALVLQGTAFGLHTFAIGSNLEAARRAGIPVNRHLIAVYALTGSLVGLVAVIDIGRFGVASIAAHSTDALQAIAGAVIGGTSLFGGRGSVLGSVVGAFIPAVLRNGFIITGLQPFWQEVAVSVVLILAVYLDQWRRSRLAMLEASLTATQRELDAPPSEAPAGKSLR